MVVTLPVPRMRDYRKQYVRETRNGKFQARPYRDGVRYNLGIFPNWNEAHKAVLAFFEDKLQAKPKYVRPVCFSRGRCQRYFIIRLPACLARRKCKNVNQKTVASKPFATPDDAAKHVAKLGTKELNRK